MLLSHAHLDHCGYLPRLVRDGFAGGVYCSPGTADLLGIMLPDAARLEEEEAALRNQTRASRHVPALPLFTTEDAAHALARAAAAGKRPFVPARFHLSASAEDSKRLNGIEGPLATDALSAHADQGELIRWLRAFPEPPAATYAVHGEPPAAAALCAVIARELGWPHAVVAADGASPEL